MKKDIVKIFFFSIFTIFFFTYFACAQVLDSEILLKMLNNLEVFSDCTKPRYLRKDWNYRFNVEQNWYKTREKVLIEESLIAPTVKKNKKVISGRWYDAYLDMLFKDPRQLDVDHLVPLSEAHKSGGCHWNKAKKAQYTNYLKHKEGLIAVSKIANRQKGSKDPARWLPQNEDYLCEYVSDWVIIK